MNGGCSPPNPFGRGFRDREYSSGWDWSDAPPRPRPDFRPYDDDTIINLSVWESVDALADYVYRTVHRDFLRRRREWFARFETNHMALWWVEAGHRPTIEEAVERIRLLSTENAQLKAELGSLKDRMANVERIVTDDSHRLTQEIDSLRAPRN